MISTRIEPEIIIAVPSFLFVMVFISYSPCILVKSSLKNTIKNSEITRPIAMKVPRNIGNNAAQTKKPMDKINRIAT